MSTTTTLVVVLIALATALAIGIALAYVPMRLLIGQMARNIRRFLDARRGKEPGVEKRMRSVAELLLERRWENAKRAVILLTMTGTAVAILTFISPDIRPVLYLFALAAALTLVGIGATAYRVAVGYFGRAEIEVRQLIAFLSDVPEAGDDGTGRPRPAFGPTNLASVRDESADGAPA